MASQDLPDAPRQRTARHRHSYHVQAYTGPSHRARNLQQVLGIVVGIVAMRQDSSVAGLFRQRGEPPFQPPGQRVEPEDRPVQQRQPLHQRIAPAGVLPLVR
jgi:hypothetical protein